MWMVSPGLAVISVTLNFISSPPVRATVLAPAAVLPADLAGAAFGAGGCCAATCVIATGRLRVRSAARQDRVMSKVLNLKIETKSALSRAGAAPSDRLPIRTARESCSRAFHSTVSPPARVVQALARAHKLFRHGRGRMAVNPVLDSDLGPCRNPPVRRNPEQTAAVDHRAARFRHRRNAEFHSPGERFAIPRRLRSAVIFFPDPHPRKVSRPPHTPEGEPR